MFVFRHRKLNSCKFVSEFLGFLLLLCVTAFSEPVVWVENFSGEDWTEKGPDIGQRFDGRWRLISSYPGESETEFSASSALGGYLDLKRGLPWGLAGSTIIYQGVTPAPVRTLTSIVELPAPYGESRGRQNWLAGFTGAKDSVTRHLILSYDTAGTNGADPGGGPGGPGDMPGQSLTSGLKLISSQGLLPEDTKDITEGPASLPFNVLQLTSEPPQYGHRYEATLGYDAATGICAVRVIDLTAGERIYQGRWQLNPCTEPLWAMAGGFNAWGNWASDKMAWLRIFEARLSDELVLYEPDGMIEKTVKLSLSDNGQVRTGEKLQVQVSAPPRDLGLTARLTYAIAPQNKTHLISEQPLGMKPLIATIDTSKITSGNGVVILELLRDGKQTAKQEQKFYVISDAELLAMKGRFEFAGRRTIRPEESLLGRFTCAELAGSHVRISLHQASSELSALIELERRKTEQPLREAEVRELERLYGLQPSPGQELGILWQGKLDKAGVAFTLPENYLPDNCYVLCASLDDDRSQAQVVESVVAELVVVRSDPDWKHFIATGLNCYLIGDIPIINNLIEAGVNLVQAHVQPDEEVRLDRLAAHDIGVLSGATMLPGIPDDAHPVQADGTPGSRQFYNVCYNNPAMPNLLHKQAQEVLAKIGTHPALNSYWTINEVADHDNVCYCENCRAKWDTLKSGIAPPVRPAQGPVEDGYLWYDWVRFRDASMREYLRHAVDETKTADVVHPVGNKGIIHYFFNHDARSPWFELAPDSDIFFYSSYAATRMDIANYAEVATSLKEPAWISEYNHLGAPDAMRGAECYSGFMHGLKGLVWYCYQPYRESVGYFGLVEENWDRGERWASVAKTFNRVRQWEPIFAQTELIRQPVGVVFSDTSMLHAIEPGASGIVERDFCGTVEALMRMKMSSTSFADYKLGESDLSHIKVLFLPSALCLAPGEVAVLERWVKAGGKLVAFAQAGALDHGKKPVQALKSLLGVEQNSLEGETAIIELAQAASMLGGSVTGGTLEVKTQPVTALEDTETLLKTIDNQPFLTKQDVGQGQAYFIATSLGEACFRKENDATSLQFARMFFEYLGLHANVDVMNSGQPDYETDATLRQLPQGGAQYVLAMNYGASGQRNFVVHGNAKRVVNLTTGETLPVVPKADGISFTADLAQWEPQAFLLENENEVKMTTRYDGKDLLVKLRGEAGIPVTLTVTDERGFGPAPVRTLLQPGVELRFKYYDIYQDALTVKVQYGF